MIDKYLTIDLSVDGDDTPTRLEIGRPMLTYACGFNEMEM